MSKEKFRLLSFGHYKFAFVIKISVNIIGPVIDMNSSCSRACCQRREACFIMGPPLISPGFGYLSFWMCHFYKILNYSILSFNSFKASHLGSSSIVVCWLSFSITDGSQPSSPSGCTLLIGNASMMYS